MTKRVALLFVLLLSFFAPAVWAVHAQNGPTFSNILVDLWPEFDRPKMLVIYRLTLSSGVNLPYQLKMRIPNSAGSPHAVAARQMDGALISLPYELKHGTKWNEVIFLATMPEIQLEYYDPRLEIQDARRSYQYVWPGDYEVGAFKIDIQRPSDASEMRVSPGTVTVQQGKDQLMYYIMNVGPLSIGQSFKISLEYEKPTDELSVNQMSLEPSAPLGDLTQGSPSMSVLLPWILGLLGIALIVGGGVWYWQSGRQKSQPNNLNQAQSGRLMTAEEKDEEHDGGVYCHQCGKRASVGDRFCRACGAPLRFQ